MKTIIKVFKKLFLLSIIFCVQISFAQTKIKADTIIVYHDEKEEAFFNSKEFSKNFNQSLQLPDLSHLHEQLRSLNDDLAERFESMGKNFSEKWKNHSWEGSPFKEKENSFSEEKSKTIHKEYVVENNDKLTIQNKFGDVNVHVWDKKEIKVDILIKVATKSDKQTQKILDGITIQEEKKDHEIILSTKIENHNNDNNCKSKTMEINYDIYMPSQNPLHISDKFGTINLPDFAGTLEIESAYGSLNAGKLSGEKGKINLSFGDGNIQSFQDGKINSKYSDLELLQAGVLELTHEFGSLELGETERLNATINYSEGHINKLQESGIIDVKFGGMKLTNISPKLKKLHINAAYSPVHLNIDENSNLDFDAKVEYGDFTLPSSLKFSGIKKIKDDRQNDDAIKASYSGRIGKGESGKISIVSKFGSVKIN